VAGTSTILITQAREELIFLKHVLAGNEVFALVEFRDQIATLRQRNG
jgi:hypothetical protein